MELLKSAQFQMGLFNYFNFQNDGATAIYMTVCPWLGDFIGHPGK